MRAAVTSQYALPQPPGKPYRLLKIVTQPATPDQTKRLGSDRAPVVIPPRLPQVEIAKDAKEK